MLVVIFGGIVTCMRDYTGFGLVTGFIKHSQIVTASNYKGIAD
jgi:hypothetical protein